MINTYDFVVKDCLFIAPWSNNLWLAESMPKCERRRDMLT